MNSIYRHFTIAACTLTLGAGLVLGAGSSAKDRRKNQQKRIGQGVRNEELTKPEYEDLATRRLPENDKKITPLLNEWGMLHTKEWIFHDGQERRLPVAPASTIEDVVHDPHLEAREYFTEIEHAELGTLKYPGAPYKFHATYVGAKHPAPLVGQHNQEVYENELGIPAERLRKLGEHGVV